MLDLLKPAYKELDMIYWLFSGYIYEREDSPLPAIENLRGLSKYLFHINILNVFRSY